MFDGPTTSDMDPGSGVLVIDLSAVYHSEALGALMVCASAWLHADDRASRSADDSRHRRGMGGAHRPGGGSLSPVVLEARPFERAGEHSRVPSGLGPRGERLSGKRAESSRRGAARRFRDRGLLRAARLRTAGTRRASRLLTRGAGGPATTATGRRPLGRRKTALPRRAPSRPTRARCGGHGLEADRRSIRRRGRVRLCRRPKVRLSRPRASPSGRRGHSRSAKAQGPAIARSDRDGLAFAAVVSSLATSWLLWVAGGLLAFFNTGRWHEVPVGGAPALVVRVLAHPTAPFRAWPLDVRRSFPSPLVTDVWFVVLAVVVVLAVGAALRMRRAPSPRTGLGSEKKPGVSSGTGAGDGRVGPPGRPSGVAGGEADRGPAGSRDARRTAPRRRGAALGDGGGADAVRQDDGVRDPGDPGVVRPIAGHEREGGPSARDRRVAQVARRGPVLRPDGGRGSPGGRCSAVWMVSVGQGCHVAGRKAHGLGAVLGGQSRRRGHGRRRLLVHERGEAPRPAPVRRSLRRGIDG